MHVAITDTSHWLDKLCLDKSSFRGRTYHLWQQLTYTGIICRAKERVDTCKVAIATALMQTYTTLYLQLLHVTRPSGVNVIYNHMYHAKHLLQISFILLYLVQCYICAAKSWRLPLRHYVSRDCSRAALYYVVWQWRCLYFLFPV